MSLKRYGWDDFFEKHHRETDSTLKPARVAAQYSNIYHLVGEETLLTAEVSGKYAYGTSRASDFPAVGDWVLMEKADEGKAVIQYTLPRKSVFSRKAAGGRDEQIIASNIDILCIVSGLDDNFNVNRIERYITLAYDSGAVPLIVLNKADLILSREEILLEMGTLALSSEVLFLSAVNSEGLEDLKEKIKPGKTAAFVGSSGVGKTTLINGLMGEEVLKTGAVRDKDGKGRHTTTGRNLMLTPHGALVIDTPGMRELALWCAEESIDGSFEDITRLAEECRFRDCSHQTEPGCAVQFALEAGELSRSRYENYQKMKKEARYLERKQDPVMNANTKRRWKSIHKQVRELKKGEKHESH